VIFIVFFILCQDETLKVLYLFSYLNNSVDKDIFSSPLKGHTGTIRVVKFQPVSLVPSSFLLASAGAGDFRPRIWDVQTGSLVSTLNAHLECVHALTWLDHNRLVR
jgi:WD40 repeat protein